MNICTMIFLEWTSHKSTMSFGFPFLLSPLRAYRFCTLIFFECIHIEIHVSFLFAPSPLYASNLHIMIQNLMEPIILSVLPRKIDIHYQRWYWFQCAHNYLWMLRALSEVRCEKGPNLILNLIFISNIKIFISSITFGYQRARYDIMIFVNIPNDIQADIQKGYKKFRISTQHWLGLHFFAFLAHLWACVWVLKHNPNLLPFSWPSLGHEFKAKIMTLNVFIISFKNVYTITPFITFFRMWCPCLFNWHHFMLRPRLKCLDHNLACLLNLLPISTSFSIAFQIQLGVPHFSIIRFRCYVCTLPINPLGIHLLQCPHDNDHIGRHDT